MITILVQQVENTGKVMQVINIKHKLAFTKKYCCAVQIQDDLLMIKTG